MQRKLSDSKRGKCTESEKEKNGTTTYACSNNEDMSTKMVPGSDVCARRERKKHLGAPPLLASRRTSFNVSRATRSAAGTKQPLVSNPGCAFLDCCRFLPQDPASGACLRDCRRRRSSSAGGREGRGDSQGSSMRGGWRRLLSRRRRLFWCSSAPEAK